MIPDNIMEQIKDITDKISIFYEQKTKLDDEIREITKKYEIQCNLETKNLKEESISLYRILNRLEKEIKDLKQKHCNHDKLVNGVRGCDYTKELIKRCMDCEKEFNR